MTAPAGDPTYHCRQCGHVLGTHARVGTVAMLHAGGILLGKRTEVRCDNCFGRWVWRPAASEEMPKKLDTPPTVVQVR